MSEIHAGPREAANLRKAAHGPPLTLIVGEGADKVFVLRNRDLLDS